MTDNEKFYIMELFSLIEEINYLYVNDKGYHDASEMYSEEIKDIMMHLQIRYD